MKAVIYILQNITQKVLNFNSGIMKFYDSIINTEAA